MDNFSGQTTTSLLEKVEEEGGVVITIPPGTTDRLQPLDVSTNKAAKHLLREKFRQWYAQEVEKQLHTGTAAEVIQVNMGMAVETSIVMNGFKNVGIVEAVKKAREF